MDDESWCQNRALSYYSLYSLCQIHWKGYNWVCAFKNGIPDRVEFEGGKLSLLDPVGYACAQSGGIRSAFL